MTPFPFKNTLTPLRLWRKRRRRAQGVRFFKERGSRLLFSRAKTNFTGVKLGHSLSLNGILWILSATVGRKYKNILQIKTGVDATPVFICVRI